MTVVMIQTGASEESHAAVVEWCQANGIDPMRVAAPVFVDLDANLIHGVARVTLKRDAREPFPTGILASAALGHMYDLPDCADSNSLLGVAFTAPLKLAPSALIVEGA